jgi:hypothetical protein
MTIIYRTRGYGGLDLPSMLEYRSQMEREIFGVDSQMMIWMMKFGVSPG